MGGRARRTIATGVVVLAAMVSLAGPAVVSAQEAGEAALFVTPSTDLTDGQAVVVDGEDFVFTGEHQVLQCVSGSALPSGSLDRTGCDATTTILVTADEVGAFTTPFTVRASITVGSGPVDCTAAGACEVVAVYATNDGPPVGSVPIEFATMTTTTTVGAAEAAVVQPSFTG